MSDRDATAMIPIEELGSKPDDASGRAPGREDGASPAPASFPADRPFRRAVLYIPGFDPKGGARYRALYRSEARRWVRIFGGEIALEPPVSASDALRWRMRARLPADSNAPERAAEIDYAALRWEDLVQDRMAAAPIWRMLRAARTFFAVILDGSIYGMMRQAWTPVVVTIYPFLLVLLYLAAMAALAIGAPVALSNASGLSAWWFAPIGVLGAWGVIRLAVWIDDHTYALYLVDLYTLMHDLAHARAPAVETRTDRFAEEILRVARSETYDEVLVVGHSGGTTLATSALARALAIDPSLGRQGAEIGLLTLGQTLSAQMQLPKQGGHQKEFEDVARSDALTWVDVSAHADAVCYALCDPLCDHAGALPSEERRAGPKVVSAAFKATMAPESFAAIERNHFRRHFQYLYVFEKPRAFDYFRITAGPISLAERFRRVPSNKRTPKTAAELSPSFGRDDARAAAPRVEAV